MPKHPYYIISILILLSINSIAAENEINRFPSPSELAYLLTQAAESQDVENTKSASNSRRNENFLAIKKGRNMAIAGTILFFSGVAIEWPLIYPWAREINEKAMETDDPDSIDTEGALLVLAASVPNRSDGDRRAVACLYWRGKIHESNEAHGTHKSPFYPCVETIDNWMGIGRSRSNCRIRWRTCRGYEYC